MRVADVHSGPFVAVVDTNVLLDIYSCHNIAETYTNVGESGMDGADALYRRVRARESLLLAMYLHKVQARTISLGAEAVTILKGRVPPENRSPEATFTKMMAHVVVPRVLHEWQAMNPDPPGEEKGNAADDALVAFAKEYRVPLITNEGFTPSGYAVGKIARRATVAGVLVFFPRDFYAGKIDEAGEIEDFLLRFHGQAPVYASGQADPDGADRFMKFMDSYFRHVLCGEASRGHPVSVTMG